jgi:lactate permease
MVGRQLTPFSIIIPFWVVWAFAGWRGALQVWPVALTAGVAYAIPQYLVSNFHGPWLVGIIASITSILAVGALLRVWKPGSVWNVQGKLVEAHHPAPARPVHSRSEIRRAWLPWIVLSLLVFLWGVPQWKSWLNGSAPLRVPVSQETSFQVAPKLPAGVTVLEFPVRYLHEIVQRVPPVAPPNAPPEKAIFTLNWLSATGTGILVSAIIAGLAMKFTFREMLLTYWRTVVRVRYSLVTIAAMLGIGYVTKYSGIDATLGLALAKTGKLYPFFGTLLGWLGVALTGSDTASNVLFGSLQRITAEQTGISATLMASANSAGGVMGKMVDAQSIVVASTATNWYGHEASILRFVFFHSVALAILMGLLVLLQARVFPFTEMVVR